MHHKILLTPNNINNPEISLNHAHLQYLCLECHNIEHGAKTVGVIREGLMFDIAGNVVEIYGEECDCDMCSEDTS